MLTLPAQKNSQAQENTTYISFAIGNNSADDSDWKNSTDDKGTYEFKTSPVFAVAIGRKVNDNFRIEGEFARRKSEMSQQNYHLQDGGQPFTNGDGYVSINSFGANIYLNLLTKERREIYFLTGLGTAQIEAEIERANLTYNGITIPVHLPKDSDSGLFYQLGFGGNFKLTDKLALLVDYRHFTILGDFNISGEDIDYSATEIRSGLRYSF